MTRKSKNRTTNKVLPKGVYYDAAPKESFSAVGRAVFHIRPNRKEPFQNFPKCSFASGIIFLQNTNHVLFTTTGNLFDFYTLHQNIKAPIQVVRRLGTGCNQDKTIGYCVAGLVGDVYQQAEPGGVVLCGLGGMWNSLPSCRAYQPMRGGLLLSHW